MTRTNIYTFEIGDEYVTARVSYHTAGDERKSGPEAWFSVDWEESGDIHSETLRDHEQTAIMGAFPEEYADMMNDWGR